MRSGSWCLALCLLGASHALAGPSIILRDRASESGLGSVVVHGGAWYGAGAVFADLNGDGWPDLYFGAEQGQWDWFCPNLRDGTFECGRATGGPVNPGDVLAIACGDYDSDGDLDLYVMRAGKNSLLANDGLGHFNDITDSAHAAGAPGITATGTFVDYDGDGRLDLFLGHWAPFGTATPAARAQLLRQLPDGTFEDSTTTAGVDTHNRPSLALLAFDYDRDGRQDLYVTNDFNLGFLFHNEGGHFADVTNQAGDLAAAVTEGMGIDAADLDGDGLVDLYATGNKHTTSAGLIPGETGAVLLANRGGGLFSERGVNLQVNADFGWGTGLADLDNDGWPDIFVATNWNDHYSIYRNQQGSAFTLEEYPGVEQYKNTCVTAAFADYDGDGRVDVVLHRTDGIPPQLLHNESANQNHFLQVALQTGHDELGAHVTVQTARRTVEREMLSQTSHGAQSERRFTFGLGDSIEAKVAVLFPDGSHLDGVHAKADREIVLSRAGVVSERLLRRGGCSAAQGGRQQRDSSATVLVGLTFLLVLHKVSARRRSSSRTSAKETSETAAVMGTARSQ